MPYIRKIETKVVRERHHVIVPRGTAAKDLIDWLANIPGDCTMSEWWDDDDGSISLEFCKENEEEPT